MALLEKPVEDRLEQIMNYRKVLGLLEQEKMLLLKEEEKEEGEDEVPVNNVAHSEAVDNQSESTKK